MATITFELKDASGQDVEIGDEVIVKFPELDIQNTFVEETYYRPGFTAKCKVLMYPSKGLRLRIIEIINIDGEPKDIYRPGQILEFRRTVMHFTKA